MKFPLRLLETESSLLIKASEIADNKGLLELRIRRGTPIGRVLRLARALQGLSQEKVAEELEIDQMKISRIERNEGHDFNAIAAMVRLYKISLDEYLAEAYPDS